MKECRDTAGFRGYGNVQLHGPRVAACPIHPAELENPPFKQCAPGIKLYRQRHVCINMLYMYLYVHLPFGKGLRSIFPTLPADQVAPRHLEQHARSKPTRGV